MNRVEVLRHAAQEAGRLLMEHPDDPEQLGRALASANTASNLLSEFASDDIAIDRETIWLTERLTRAVRMAVSLAEQDAQLGPDGAHQEVISASHFANQLAQSLQLGLDEAYRRDDPTRPSRPGHS